MKFPSSHLDPISGLLTPIVMLWLSGSWLGFRFNIYSNLTCLIFQSVPIFALHPLGSYYIPLVVNYGLLAPFLTFAEEPKAPEGLTLHPVTTFFSFNPVGPLDFFRWIDVLIILLFRAHPLYDHIFQNLKFTIYAILHLNKLSCSVFNY